MVTQFQLLLNSSQHSSLQIIMDLSSFQPDFTSTISSKKQWKERWLHSVLLRPSCSVDWPASQVGFKSRYWLHCKFSFYNLSLSRVEIPIYQCKIRKYCNEYKKPIRNVFLFANLQISQEVFVSLTQSFVSSHLLSMERERRLPKGKIVKIPLLYVNLHWCREGAKHKSMMQTGMAAPLVNP